MKIEQQTQMRDGSVAEDPRLGRLIQFDEKSRGYSVRATLEQEGVEQQIHNRSWYQKIMLDQGQTSACVGNSRTYDLAGSPIPLREEDGHYMDEDFAQQLYREAQKLDEWEGEDYEGSSVLGGLKAAVDMGYIGEYRWAFTIDDMCAAISNLGPVVVGTNWLNSMFEPRPNGLLEIDANSGVAGGHAWCIPRIAATKSAQRAWLGKSEPLREGDLLLGMRQSWGESWGHKGQAWLWASDYEDFLMKGGEQSVVTTAFHH